MAAKVTTWYLECKRMLMLRNSSPFSGDCRPFFVEDGKHWLVWRSNGKVTNPRKESSSSYSPCREAKASDRRLLEFYPLFSSRFPDCPKPPNSSAHLSCYLFLFTFPFVVSSTGIHCPVANFSSFHASARARIRKDEEAFRRGTRWRVRETEKQKSEGEREKEKERKCKKDWLWEFQEHRFLPKYVYSLNARQYLRLPVAREVFSG